MSSLSRYRSFVLHLTISETTFFDSVYITPSAYLSIAEWMKYREESGEIITDDSWVMHDLWDTQVKISKGLVTIPKQLTSIGVKRLMERAIRAQVLRKELEAGKKRHPFPTNHSLRNISKQDVN
ncbi:MAG TPA: hypothetical protein VFS97_09095 [Nitrososphaeraceae archaeon]|nr:hypothetical protein [Nitrososphaeraceae archaeon]